MANDMNGNKNGSGNPGAQMAAEGAYKKSSTGNGSGPSAIAATAPGPYGNDETVHVGGRQLAFIMIGVLLGLLLAALDQTIVGPALPRIIRDLNGFEHYSWVVTIYLLTSTITVPIFGKLSDMYGRKWFYVSGIVVFLVGSMLSGLSADIFQLIVFRGIQGIGAGVLMANAFTIIADVIPPANRGKWQGAFGGVFGLSSVIGPTIGGFLTDKFDWRWVFYVNVPIGIIALATLVFTFPNETKHSAKKVIDYAGAALLTLGMTPLLLALSLRGTNTKLSLPIIGNVTEWNWSSPSIITLLVLAAVFTALFVFAETKAKEPILPLDLFRNTIFTVSAFTVFVTGVGLFGAVLYIPLFIQAIQGDTATSSGNSVTPMTLGIVLSSIVTGQIISRTGKYRIIGIAGMALVTVGMFLLYSMNMDTPRFTTIAYMIVMGLGLGVSFPLFTLVVQNAFPIQKVGVVTAAIQFFRSIGSTVGVAILGGVVNQTFHDKFPVEFGKQVGALPPEAASRIPVAQLTKGLSNLNPQSLVGVEGAQRLHDQMVNAFHVPVAFADQLVKLITGAMKPALFSGIQESFLIGGMLVGLGLIATMFLKEIPLRKSNRPQPAAMAEGGHGGEFEAEAEEAGREMAAAGMPGATNIPADEEPVVAVRR